MEIRELKADDVKLVKDISILHKKAFPSFFLTQLGLPFLNTLYKGYLEDNESGIIIAEEDNNIIGFIAYSRDYPKFYKGLIKHKIIQFAWYSFLASIRHPSFVNRLLGAFKKSDSVKKTEKYVELSSICVDPTMESKGIGTLLITYLKRMIDFNTYAYINLETDAKDNDKANAFYVKNEFKLANRYITAEGRRMNEYRFYQMENNI